MTDDPSLGGIVVPQIDGLSTERSPADDGDNDIAVRVRAWWLACVRSEFWRNYSDKAEEDQEYRAGEEGQWTKDGDKADLARLQKDGRATVTANHIEAPLESVSGYERQNRTDLKALPEGNEDADSARVWSWLLKHAQRSCHAQDVMSEVFDNGNTGGLRAAEIAIDWQRGTRGGMRRAGQLHIEDLKCGLASDAELVWDDRWKEYDASDARFMLRWRWVAIDDALAQWPEKREALESSIARLDQNLHAAATEKTTVRLEDYTEGGTGGTHLSPEEVEQYFYHPADRRVLLCEAWYHVYDEEWAVVDKRTGRPIPFHDEKSAAVEFAASDPNRLRVDRQPITRVRMSVVIPATGTVLEHDRTPYPNDDEAYPFAIYTAKRQGKHVYGLVRNMKDPQRVENKRISQLLDLIDRFVRMRALVQEDSLVDPNAMNDPLADGPIRYKRGPDVEKPSWFVPPIAELAPVLIGMAEKMKSLLREIPAIDVEYNIGRTSSGASGRAIDARTAQSQLTQGGLFDRFNRTKKYANERLARRVQQLYTTDEIVRLTGDLGQSVLVRLNPADAPPAPEPGGDRDAYLTAFRQFREQHRKDRSGVDVLSLAALHYDIVLAEEPSTPTARQATLRTLLDLIAAVAPVIPGFAELFLPTLLRLMDGIPDRDQILAEVERMRAARAAPPPGPGGPMPPDAMPPGVPAIPGPPGLPPSLAGQNGAPVPVAAGGAPPDLITTG